MFLIKKKRCKTDIIKDELLMMLPQPVLAMLLLFPITEKYGEYSKVIVIYCLNLNKSNYLTLIFLVTSDRF